uniref:Nitroreductase domain-containing protein n=1 Tax=Aplanochytrium stocchinoi TaxID=215587 RepID=A0A6S8CF35_9STRA|mmetsp:Transcript_16386/g.20261  ORF Transcript_16386/g.20261 Transcript_16386/m.20261 type:complete len:302 (+) Transcript_16386:287-1192(+)|eukprot:CAMPEP_0204824310 /NCGR_PEP_ID=MMETSP1346-20131115/2338_1 /ASSEMBLY_ACC=CAM_ASM_000771 /TAXON_ID=215587 /ORGANISM="Aplanochytrium stocchinoi, Strain GSBS06" /LENGTH=301 /DNA_ID=CAMNT_0051951391 /DNA_START=375 /DNA_END=1280 /DNA_ORIENTATION=-
MKLVSLSYAFSGNRNLRCFQRFIYDVAIGARPATSMFIPTSSKVRCRIFSNNSHNPDADAEAFSRIVKNRTCTKEFDPSKSVPLETLEKILSLTQRAPSSFNLQPYKAVIVRDEIVKKRVAYCMTDNNIKKVLNASLTLVFASDLKPGQEIDKIMALEREHGLPEQVVKARKFGATVFVGSSNEAEKVVKKTLFSTISQVTQMPTINSSEGWAFKNTMTAAQTFILGCHAYGLATAPMEGFDARRIRDALYIPDRYEIPVVVSVGYPSEEEKPSVRRTTPRLPYEDVFYMDSFDFPAYKSS